MGALPAAAPAAGWDAVVIGAGVAGLAIAIHLRRGGLRVLCVEPEPFPRQRVGESLDWSAPALLDGLGVAAASLIDCGAATVKSNIKIVSNDRPPIVGEPPDWWGHPPLGFAVKTVHVDRLEMDRRLFRLACGLGVEFRWERVTAVIAERGRVQAVETVAGSRLEARWFFDAAGRGPGLLARQFGIRRVDYGERKVCFWSYIPAACENPGTTFYIDGADERYLSWIWEIPITPEVASVGCVLTAEFVKQRRRTGRSPREILLDRLALFPRFADLAAGRSAIEVHATAYQCHVHTSASGPNWLILGEAAALHDALTGNGVTAALRHAREGASLVLAARARGRFTAAQRRAYNRNLRRMGRVFNHGIERAVYSWPVRRAFGLEAAQLIYVSCAFSLNALYSRFEPRRWPAMLAFGALTRAIWLWIEAWSLLGRLVCGARSLRPR